MLMQIVCVSVYIVNYYIHNSRCDLAGKSFSNSEVDLFPVSFQKMHVSTEKGLERVCCQTAAVGGERATR